MKYPYPAPRIEELVRHEKHLPEGDLLVVMPASKGKGIHSFETRPQLVEGPFLDMRYLGKAPVPADTKTYDATFLLANQRVRGVGYAEVGRHRFRFKERIQVGWHLNLCDPNVPTTDPRRKVHQPLNDFSVSDFHEFIRKTAALWRIRLGEEWEGGLL